MKGLAVKAGWFIAALLLSVQAQADTYYFHNDQLGTPQVLTDDTQTVVWKGEYDPFGKVTETVSTVEQNLRFPGQYYDQETGLHYNYFRTYDPILGRYLRSDPIGLAGGLSTYGYVEANPIRFYDPFGLTNRDPNSQYCRSLSRRIENLEKELEKRYEEYAADEKTLPERIGPGEGLAETRRGHRTKINETDSRLKKNLKKYNDECGPPPPPQRSTDEESQCSACETATQVVITGGAAYIAYRCARMIPSLIFPPLWPTIPANTAIP